MVHHNVRGYLRIAPLIKEVEFDSKLEIIRILAVPGLYQRIVTKMRVTISGTPSWDPVHKESAGTELDAVRALVAAGLTVIESDDCVKFTRSWLPGKLARATPEHAPMLQAPLAAVMPPNLLNRFPQMMLT